MNKTMNRSCLEVRECFARLLAQRKVCINGALIDNVLVPECDARAMAWAIRH